MNSIPIYLICFAHEYFKWDFQEHKFDLLFCAFSQEILIAGGYNAPRTIHEVIAHLACRLARWDDR